MLPNILSNFTFRQVLFTMTRNLWVWVLVLTLMVQSASAQQKEFGWLVGTWQETGKSNFEVWALSDNELRAESYELRPDGSKKVSERIRLIRKGSDFLYVPDVPHNKGPVEFKITSFDASGFVAENPEHDFPKKITYQIDGMKMQATISHGSKTYSYFFHKTK